MRAVVWLPPFVIVGYGAVAPDGMRILVAALLVGIGALAWLARAAFGRDQFSWRSPLGAWLGIAFAAVFLAALAANPGTVFGALLPTGWLAMGAAIGFVLLLSQEYAALSRMRGRLVAVLAGLYVIAALYPTAAPVIATRSFERAYLIPPDIAISRSIEYGVGHFGFFGAGLGAGTQSFWELAELADVEQTGSAPRMPNAYLAVLWEGGPLLLLALLVFGLAAAGYAFFSSRRALARLGPQSRFRTAELARRNASVALFALLIVLWFIPPSFIGLLTLGLLAVLCAAGVWNKSPEAEARRTRTIALNSRLTQMCARGFVIILIAAFAYGAFSVARFVADPASAHSKSLERALSGFDYWRAARASGQSLASGGGNVSVDQTREWYETALDKLPRNLILRVEAGQFYRLVAQDQDAAARVVAQGMAIDATYLPLILERAAQLQAVGQNEQALALLLPHVGESATVAYQAGKLSLAAGNAEQAVPYYESALQQNPNHLQARFELVQSLIATGKIDDARSQLEELSSRVPEDDVQTQGVISQLRGLVEE